MPDTLAKEIPYKALEMNLKGAAASALLHGSCVGRA